MGPEGFKPAEVAPSGVDWVKGLELVGLGGINSHFRLFAFLRMENYPGIRTQIFGSLIEIPMNLLGKPMNFSTNFPGRPVS